MGRKKLIPNVEIKGIADKGKSIGRDAEGRVIFVENAAPGDVVDVLVYKKKKGFMIGTPQAFLHYSKDRVEPFCQHFDVCGGCKWQHLAYEAQVRHKEKVVADALQRIGKVKVGTFHSILPSERTTYYRNKLEFSFSSKRWLTREEIRAGASNEADVLGFHPPGAFDKVIDIEHCWLQEDPSNDIRNGIRAIAHAQELPFFDIKANEGFLRTLMLRTTTLDEVLIVVAFYLDDPGRIRPFLDEVLQRFSQITSLYYCINPKGNDSMNDLEMILYHGKETVEEKLREVRFKIGPKSFFQTNTRQAERLYDVVVDFAGLKGDEHVYDLYTGIGSIALYVANNCRKVVGIEEIEGAIEDARKNAALNGIDNATFYAGDVKDVLTPEFAERHGKPDLVITDPPRAGMHPQVVEMLGKLRPPRIVYVSCNPATQARDLNLLSDQYEVLRAQPVDMFPHTHHVENVALLRGKGRG
jgi:23S rRNA (uracil1939-C5)-methyltransferase